MKKELTQNFLIYLVLLLSIITLITCKDIINDPKIPDKDIPKTDVSFSKHIQPIFNARCATSGCHDDITRAANYSMTTWSNIVQPGFVDPFLVSTSKVVWSIEGIGVQIMPPPSYGYLTKNQIEGIKTWISEGAKNN